MLFGIEQAMIEDTLNFPLKLPVYFKKNHFFNMISVLGKYATHTQFSWIKMKSST